MRFEGATHNLSGNDKPWLSANGLKAYMRFQKTPYLGNLPPELRALCPENPRRVLEDLDRLAGELRDGRYFSRDAHYFYRVSRQNHLLAGKSVHLTYLGSGSYGHAFAIKPEDSNGKDDAPFVLKIYKYADHIGIYNHGSNAENSSGVRYSHQPIKDKARYYCGNPVTGWMINERITPDMDPRTRPGKWMYELGIHCRDDLRNKINHIVFEEGGLVKGVAFTNLPKDMLQPAYDWLMQERPEHRETTASWILSLPIPDQKGAFNTAIRYPESRKQATSHIRFLAENDRTDAFYTAMQYPECRERAAYIITYLPEADQKTARDTATQYPECRSALKTGR